MRYLEPRTAATQARSASAMRGGPGNAADAVADLIRQLGLPNQLSAYGLTDADLVAAAKPVASERHPLEDLLGIFSAAL
jgi:hypothetical protein